MMADDNKPIHELRFDAAVKVIQSLPADGSFQPSNEMMLKFYSYYKQATQGPCNIPRPGFWDPVGKVKWDAWSALGEMSQEEAMTAYVEEMKLILESMPMSDEVERLLQILGPFYELVHEQKATHPSELSTGIGGIMGKTSKAMTKSIIRTMEMNGSLERHMCQAELQKRALKNAEPAKIEEMEEEEEEDEEEDEEEEEEDEEEEEEVVEVKKAPPRKKGSAGKPKTGLSNGSVAHGDLPLTNGTHCSKAALNGNGVEAGPEDSLLPDGCMEVNGHISDYPEDMCGHQHVASDSDSEVYCDSVDQFGMEEGSEVNASRVEELEENHHSTLSSSEEQLGAEGSDAEDLQAGPGAVQCGGEDGKSGSGSTHRHRAPAENTDGSLVRRSRASRTGASSSGGVQGTLQGSGGDGERWRSEGPAGGNLNEQIVTALARLQEDMQSVLQRLHSLEALTASQARSLALPPTFPSPQVAKKPSWWPFDVSPGTVAFAVVWPFVAQWLIHVFLQRRRRRTN